MKKASKRLALGMGSSLVAMGLIFGTVTAAQAATTMFFSGSVAHNTKKTEATAYQTRDGIKAGFTNTSASGQAKITVWFGAYYNSCWAVECTQSGPRTYHLGALKWEMPGGRSTDKIGMSGTALNVGRLQRAAPVSGDTRITTALSSAASSYSLAAADLEYLTSYEGVDVWTAEAAGNAYLFTATPDGYATGAATPDAQFQVHGITIGLVGESGVSEQFVLLPDTQPAISMESGLQQLTDGLYVDSAFESRVDDEVVALSPTLEVGLSADEE